MPKEKMNEKNNKKDEKKQEIAKIYGLNLKNIEHVKLDNGHEFFKFKNPKDNSIKIIENIDYGVSMDESFKNTQNNLSIAQSSDSKKNTNNVYEDMLKNKNIELQLVSLADFKYDKWKYKRILRGLSTRIRTQIKFLLKNSKKINLRYINIDYGFGVNENGDIIDVQVDFINRRVNMEIPETVKYDNKEINIDDQEYNISTVNLDEIFNEINIDGNEPTIVEVKDLNIAGEIINTKTVIDVYNTPEILDKLNFSKSKKDLYMKICETISHKLDKKDGMKNSKQFTLTNNYKGEKDENRAA